MVAKATTKTQPRKATRSTTGLGRAETQASLEGQAAQRTSAAAWRQKGFSAEVEVPSGNVAKLRRPGPEMFLKTGKIPDALTPVVNEAIRSKQGLPPEKAADLMGDPEMLPQIMEMVDAAVVSACIEPRVVADPPCIRPSEEDSSVLCGRAAGETIHAARDNGHTFIPGDAIPPEERNPDFLYAAEVDFNDKMFIFQYALGGSADLDRFREEFAESVASVDAVAGNSE